MSKKEENCSIMVFFTDRSHLLLLLSSAFLLQGKQNDHHRIYLYERRLL